MYLLNTPTNKNFQFVQINNWVKAKFVMLEYQLINM